MRPPDELKGWPVLPAHRVRFQRIPLWPLTPGPWRPYFALADPAAHFFRFKLWGQSECSNPCKNLRKSACLSGIIRWCSTLRRASGRHRRNKAIRAVSLRAIAPRDPKSCPLWPETTR